MTKLRLFLFSTIFLGSFLLLSSPALAAISLVQSNSTYPGGVGPTGLAFGSNNTAGNLIVVGVQGANNSTDPTITDTRGNTYVKVGSATGGNGPAYDYLYYAKNIAAGANTVSVTLPNGADLGFHISEWSGIDTVSPLIASSTGVGTSSTALWSATSATVSSNNALLVVIAGTETSNETFTAGSNFTLLSQQSTHSSAAEYRIVSSAGSYDATITGNSATNDWVMVMGAFKAATVTTPAAQAPFLARSRSFLLDPPAFNSISGYTSSTSYRGLAAGGQPADGFSSSTSYKPCAGQLCTFFLTGDSNPANIAYLSGYRWFSNANATTTGGVLAALNTSATGPAQGTAFRLRTTLHAPVDYSVGPTVSTLPVESIDNTASGATAWTSVNNVLTSDDLYATVALPNASLPSHYLEAKNFGFNIPADAVITGIYVEVDRKDDGAKLRDAFVSIFKTDGTPNLGTASSSLWSSTEQTVAYGGASDLWTTTFTAAEVNSPDFGFGIGVWGDSGACAGGCNAYVDNIRVTVYYRPENLKLQYATKSGTCDVAFSGETYADVATSSGALRFSDNAAVTDNDTITASSSDPVHSTHNIVAQTYQESNNFGVTSTISAGDDGLWDFSLVDFSSPASTTYCFRVVSSSGASSTPEYVPEITVPGSSGVTISGTVYADAGITTTTSSVSISINGAAKTTVATNGSGAFSFSGISTPNSGDVVTVWMDNNGGGNGTGATVTRYNSGSLSGLDIYKNRMIVRHEDSGPIINTDIDACTKTLGAGCADSDIHFDVSGSALTVDSDWGLYLWGGDTFTPGGTVTLAAGAASSTPGGDLTWASSTSVLNMAANALSVGGDWRNDAAGTATITSNTTTFTATQPGMVINSGNKNFGNVTFNGVGGTWSASTSPMTVGGGTGLTMTAGTLDNSMGIADISVAGGVNAVSGSGTGDGFINLTSNTFTLFNSSGGTRFFGISNTINWNFNNLVFRTLALVPSTYTNQSAASTTITIAGTFSVGSSTDTESTTFNASSSVFVLSGAVERPLTIASSPASTFTPASSTVKFTGNNPSGNTQIPALAYYKLETNNAAETYNLTGTASTSNSLTVTAGTLDIATSSFAIGDGLTVASGATFTGSSNVTLTLATNTASFLGTTLFTAGTFNFDDRLSNKTINLGSASASTTLYAVNIDSTGISPTLTFSGTGGGLRALNNLSIGALGIVTLAVTTDAPFRVDGNFNNTGNGTFNASSSVAITIGGNFLSDGTLTTASSTFTFTGSTPTSTIGGAAAITFYNLNLLAPTVSRTYQFTSGKTYYVNGALGIAGTSSSIKAAIGASTGGVQWLINHQGTENVQFANIADSGCDGSSTNISVMSADNLDNGNNGTCWLFQTLAMTLSTTTISLPLSSGNTWTATSSNTLTVTSTVESGYSVTAFASGLLTSGSRTISDWPNTYSAPATWASTCSGGGECGFGYNTNDADITQFSGSKYAAFSSSTPGDIVATKSTSARGDQTVITYRVSVPITQAAGAYTNSLNFILTQQF